LSAIIDFKAQYNTHVNMFIKKGTTLTVEAGDPLIQMIPLSEHAVEIKTHLISGQEYNNIADSFVKKSMWGGQHKALYNQPQESKCPFGFK
jgi:hypothetical protein